MAHPEDAGHADAPLITIGICTWNRQALLQSTLESLTKLRADGISYEIIVVDNNSTDGTAAVLQSYLTRLPLRVVFESRQGLSHARNALVEAARGRHLIWTDDDVLVDPGWLAAYARAFAAWPDLAVFGGPIDPWYEETPPAWLPPAIKAIGGIYLVVATPDGPISAGDARLPFGANMAFRTDVLRQFPFDPTLGRNGNFLASGEESAVIQGILALGHRGHWVPDATVQHFIPAKRLTLGYVRKWYHDHGSSLAANGRVPKGSAIAFGRPVWVWRQALQHEGLYRINRLLGRPDRYVRHLSLASSAWGMLRHTHRA